MGYCYKNEAAFRWMRKALELEFPGLMSADKWQNYGTIFMRGGMAKFWRALIADLGLKIPPYQRAAIYAELKDVDNVFKCLKEATQVPLEMPLSADPRFDGIRKDRRYANLLQELGW